MNPSEVQKIILDFAQSDSRVRAVILNGSRANPNIISDPYQDFDITFLVNNMEEFKISLEWTRAFGEKLIFQLPDRMSFGSNPQKASFTCLMMFKGDYRIDLTLFLIDKFPASFTGDSLSLLWLDKDKRLGKFAPPSDKDYWIRKPKPENYADTCNEFWWVSTYVCKALLRNETIYAKEMLETILRKMLLQLISWYIGAGTRFSISLGQNGRHIQKYLEPLLYQELLSTYPDAQPANIKTALLKMIRLFAQLSANTSLALGFVHNLEEETNVSAWLIDSLSGQEH